MIQNFLLLTRLIINLIQAHSCLTRIPKTVFQSNPNNIDLFLSFFNTYTGWVYSLNLCNLGCIGIVTQSKTSLAPIQRTYFFCKLMPKKSILVLLLSLLVLHTVSQSSTPASSSYNRYISVGNSFPIQGWNFIQLNNPSGSAIFTDHFFTSNFASTISAANKVYYSTQAIDARIFNRPYPNDNSQVNLEYTIDLVSKTESTIVTNIRGYFEQPHFYMFVFRFLLVLSNPWESDYMVLQYVDLMKGDKQQSINLPAKYDSSHTMQFCVLLKDAKAQFSYSDVSNDNDRFYIQWTSLLSTTTLTITLEVPAYFQTGYYNIRYLVIVIDYTILNQDFPQYQFDTASYSGIGNSEFNVNMKYSLTTSYVNYMFGLSQVQFHLRNNANFQFKLISYGSSLGCRYLGNVDGYTNFTYAHTAFIYFDCPSSYYRLYNGTDNRCYDTCKPLLYFNATNQSCEPCRFDCLTCNALDNCLSCNTTYRYLSNFSCLPNAGFYQSGTEVPYNCSSDCYVCAYSAANCTACALNKSSALSGNSCVACGALFEGCGVCTEHYCIACLTNYTLVNSSYCNLPCSDANCAVCSNLNTSVCLLCKTTNFSINSVYQCIGICGDGKIFGEACDDGNSVLHDGCNDCTVESGYKCYNKTAAQGFVITWYCAYQRGIDFRIVSVEKLVHSNELAVLISVEQYVETFWRTKSVLSYCFMETPVPYRNMRVESLSTARLLQAKLSPVLATQYPPQSLFLVTFEYLSSMQGMTVALSFNFKNATDLTLTDIPVNSVSLEVQSGNNHFAHFYSANTYSNQRALEKVFTLMAAVALLMYAVSMFLGGKRIAAEQIVVLQLGYLGLLTLPGVNPLHSSLSALSTAANGVNILYDPALPPFNDVLSDPIAKGAGMYSQFLYNFNLGIVVIVLPMLVGIGAFLASKMGSFNEARAKQVERTYRLALGEYTFSGLVFASSIVGASAVLEARFGFKEIASTVGLVSLVVAASSLLLYPVYLVLRLCAPVQFEEYSGVLRSGRGPLAFQAFYCFLGLLFGAAFAAFPSFQYTNCAVTAVCLVLFCLTLCHSLFRKQAEHYRTQLNLLTIALSQVPFIYSRLNPAFEYSSESDLALLLPLLLAFLLALNLLGNLAFFVYAGVKRVKEGAMTREMQEARDAAKREEQKLENLYKSSLINPLQYLKKPKFINSFIEESDRDSDEAERLQMVKQNYREWKGGSILNPDSQPAKVVVLSTDYIHSQFNGI